MTKPVVNRVAVVIPALNEALTIEKVVSIVHDYATPIVVDDGSIDGTGALALKAGAVVVVHNINQGYDAALQSGLLRAIELKFDFAITLDADGQHNPYLIDQFKLELINGADLVIGSRDHLQRFAENIFSWFGKVLWNIPDPLCGMKGYRLLYLSRLGYFDSYQSVGTEYSIRCAKSRLNLVNIPVPTQKRVGISRFGTGFKANYKILRALFLGIIRAQRFRV
jgi:glycosyltransferase involved in cell wall biosynthesis